MNKCSENPLKTCKPITPSKAKSTRECCCFKEYDRLKNNLKMMEFASTNRTDIRSKTNKLHAEEQIGCQKKHKSHLSNRNKTWLEVLRESPDKENNRRVIQANDEKVNFPRKCVPVTSGSTKPNKNPLQNINLKQFSSTLSDENFLRNLIEFNRFVQAVCSKNVENYTNTPQKSLNFNEVEIKSPQKISHTAAVRNARKILITDDNKCNLWKPSNISKSPTKKKEKHKETVDLQVKALIKLLESMQSVTESSQIQRDAIQNLTQLIVQLRNENKALDKLKEIRTDLESKLASICTENTYLKKQLQSCEEERDKSNRLLQEKENEIEMLKKQIKIIKQHTVRENGSFTNYDIDKPSLEMNNLDETIGSVPSNNQSFDALIRPASSSPTEEIMGKWRDRNIGRRQEDDDSGIQSNPVENNNSKTCDMLTASRVQALSKINENVKKTMKNLEADLKLNDVSLNLSDATYKLSLSSLV